jgi:hypothetical protein
MVMDSIPMRFRLELGLELKLGLELRVRDRRERWEEKGKKEWGNKEQKIWK